MFGIFLTGRKGTVPYCRRSAADSRWSRNMAKVDVVVPQLGDEENKVEEATVSFWYFDEGADVKEGDDLVEVVTDKADFRIPAPASGKLAKRNANEDDVVKIGDVIAVIET